jgi:arginine-tRNA-protein transferase
MKYTYEGKVIGIGVVDIVDDGLSSVYFFYDPAFKEYRLGVFSSIIEIEYVRWMRLSFPEFRYYYMGFYISNSEKMNYKGNSFDIVVDYMPCQLLCPITYHFVDFTEEIKAKVERIDKGEEKDIRLAHK